MRINISKIGKVTGAVFMMCVLFRPVYAADMSALDFNGEPLGKVIPDGSVINPENELIGYITADGFVFNNDEEFVGGIVPQGIAISVDNKILGKVNNDGSVTSINDSFIGKTLPNGLVVNNNYDVIGAVISQGLVYNDEGTIVGRVSGDGKFYNLSGQNNGFVSASGYVYTTSDDKVKVIGKLISSKMVISSTGKFLGSITPDGKVTDIKKNQIGAIHANGFTYNADGNTVGHIVESGYAFDFNGSYLGVVSYNGEIINKKESIGTAVWGNRAIGKNGELIGFTIGMSAVAITSSGEYLGRVIADGIVVKGRDIVGKIGSSGDVINQQGQVIGSISRTGPVFDYLGQLKAEAAVDGSVVSFEGINIGYMQKDRAFDYKEKEIGRTIKNRIVFDNSNSFMGISGINSAILYKGQNYIITPYGYVIDNKGMLAGTGLKFSGIYAEDGKFLSAMSSNGRIENPTLNEKSKLTSAGYLIDKSDRLLGRAVSAIYASDFLGKSLGYINPTNLIINDKNETYAKIMPDNNVVALSADNNTTMGQASSHPLSVSINGYYLGSNTEQSIVQKNQEVIGKISSSGYVLDNQGALYGHTVPFGVVISTGCKSLGVVSNNGDARTATGTYLGTILANKQIINDSEEIIGYIISPQAVIGKNGEVIGVENALGTVLNAKNQNLGCQDIDGKVRNTQKEIVGITVPYAPAMNFDNTIIGYTDFSGKIKNTAGDITGLVEINGGVVSAETKDDIGVLFKYTVAFDDNNLYLGRIDFNGNVVSDVGETIGHVAYNGAVTTNDGRQGFALYDLYVYDNEGKTIGYIAKNGRIFSIMDEPKGVLYHGFVLDKKQNLIARGARDYDIRDENKKIIGYLDLDGNVINVRNIEVGKLNEKGEIINNSGNIIAVADPLQYYHKPEAPKEEIVEDMTPPVVEEKTESKTENQKTEEIIEKVSEPEMEVAEEIEPEIPQENTHIIDEDIIGIAIVPGGKILGNVRSSGDVVDENGNIIGHIGENGDIVDSNGRRIGVFQERQAEKPKPANNSKWWQSVIQGVTVSPYDNKNNPSNVGPGGGIGPGGRYNPKRAAILEQLYNTRRQNLSGKTISNSKAASYTGWQDNWTSLGFERSVSSLRVDMSNMITADKPIPAIIARSLISLGDAPVTAIVERNIYGDAGRNVIIPAGSRIIGSIEKGNMEVDRFNAESGGMKMEITWFRIIRPDGIAFSIRKAKTGDAEGRGGGALGYVDEQLLKKYTMPLLGTMATSAISYMIAANEDATGEVETSKQQAATDAREQFLNKMNEILDRIMENKEKIQAVTYIPAGTRVIIYPMEDLWLRTTKDIKSNTTDTPEGKKPTVFVSGDEQKSSGNNKEVQSANNQNNNNAPKNAKGKGKGSNSQTNQKAPPPPASDGSIADSGVSKEDEESGEIDLDF